MATDGNASLVNSLSAEYERLGLVVEGLIAGVWDWDIQTDEVYWSQILFRQLGYQANEIEPSLALLREHVHADDLGIFNRFIRDQIDQHKQNSITCRIRGAEGKYGQFRVGGKTLRNEHGEPLRFVGWMQDMSQSQFRSLVETTSDWVWEMDLEGCHTYSNHRVEQILGYTTDEFCQMQVLDFFHAEDRKEVERRFPELIAKKEGWSNWLIRIRGKDGNYRLLESSATPVLNASDELIGYRGIDRDVTERRLEQEEINDRLRFELLVSELSASFLSVPFGQIDEVLDHTMERLAEFFDLDQCAVAYLSPDDNESFLTRVWGNKNTVKLPLKLGPKRMPWTASIVDAGEVVRISDIEELPAEAEAERAYMHASGVKAYLTIPMELSGQVMGRLFAFDCRSIRDWSSSEVRRLQFIGGLIATLLVRKQQEMELETTRSMLMASVESSPAGIVIADVSDGKVRIVNRAALSISDMTAEAVSGMSPEEYTQYRRLFHSNGEPYAPEDLPLSRAILAGETSQNISMILELPDGEQKWLLSNAAPVRDALGEIVAGVVVFMDITELKQAAVEREMLIQELEDKNAELERFSYTVSHDLKSPLITIKGFLGLLRNEIQAGEMEKVDSRIEKIVAASDQMSRLLHELLELSRIGRVENAHELVSVTDLAQQAAILVGSAIEGRQVDVDIEADMPSILVDRIRMVEVFQNLIDNAVRFAGHGTEPKVQVGVQQREGNCECFVADNGAGIAPAYQEKVFGLFEQLQPELGGTGIGLAIVKRIVEVHGGEVWIESEGEGQGTKVCFTVPTPELGE